MKNIDQIIKFKLSLAEESLINNNYIRGFSHNKGATKMSFAYLNQQDEQESIKNMIWKRFLRNPENSKRFKQLQDFNIIDTSIIMKALEQIQKTRDEDTEFLGNSYYVGTIGKLSYEFFEE